MFLMMRKEWKKISIFYKEFNRIKYAVKQYSSFSKERFRWHAKIIDNN